MGTPVERQRPRLDIGDAVQEGWRAFCRNPRSFVAFPLMVVALQFLIQPLQTRIGSVDAISTDPLDWLLYLVGLTVNLGLNLWCAMGLVRGSWTALEGGRPSLGEMLRWDGRTFGRLLRAWLFLVLLGVAGLVVILIGAGGPLALLSAFADRLVPINREVVQLLGLVLALALLVLLSLYLLAIIYLTVNQNFLTQIVLLEGSGAVASVQRGRRLVDPSWPMVLLLTLLEALLLLVGLLACLVGFFVAWPLVICVSSAAYRQLLETDGGMGQDSATIRG